MKSFWNPFTTYALACILVVLIYLLGFSALYPPLSMGVILFLAYSAAAAILFSLFVVGTPIPGNAATFGNQYERQLALLFVGGFAVEFAHFGGVPLLQLLNGVELDYRDFGIPTFHVVLVGTCFFFSVYWWDCYLASRNSRFLFISLIGVAGCLLMMSRGGALILLLAFIFAFGNRRGLRRRAKFLGVFAVGLILGFGYLGEVRMGAAGRNLILSIGEANESFTASGLPDAAFWFYLYTSSPLANLQYTALNRPSDSIQLIGIAADFLPDFLSKYFVSPEEFEDIASMRISNGLTVGTAYARPLITLGWIGPYALHTVFLTFFYGAISFAKTSRYYGALLAIFCAQGCLMFFDNMLVFAGAITPALVGLSLVAMQRIRLRPTEA